MPRKIWTMEEINKLDTEQYVELMPDEYLLEPDVYLRTYADMAYQRFVHMVICEAVMLMPLNNGDRLKYHQFIYRYEPLYPIAASN